MAGLWWIGVGAVVMAVMTALYVAWWVIRKLFSPPKRNHTVVYLKTGKGLVRKEY